MYCCNGSCQTFEFTFKNAYYGDKDDFERFCSNHEFDEFIESITPFDPQQVVNDLEDGPLVWFDGGAEMGPRALGARSLIGDPRKMETKDRLNDIKLRQWWRPVAPIILKDCIEEWFEETFESPYMLHAVKIREEKRAEIPAILHEDNSARFQSICKEDGQDRLYQVIEAFYKKTGVPIICNTSLNDKGEPIINRMDEAMNFALRKKIRIIYLNGNRVVLKNHEHYQKDKPLRRSYRAVTYHSKVERDALIRNIGFGDFKQEYVFYALQYDIALTSVLEKYNDPKKWYAVVKLYVNKQDSASRQRCIEKFGHSEAVIETYLESE